MLVRIGAAAIVAIAFSALTQALLAAFVPELQANDFTYPWLAARAMLRGDEPYAAVLAGPTPYGGALFYPLPAAVLAIPYAWLPARLAGVAFVATGTGLLAFLITRGGMWRLALFLSAPAYAVCRGVQWSPLLVAAALLPPALGALIVKPTLALPLLLFQSQRRSLWFAIVGAAVLLAASFAFSPAWPSRWIESLDDPQIGQYAVPILTPWGAILALAALRWRRPEGRLVLAMACVPQNGYFYEQLPLLLVPSTNMELLVAGVISHVAYALGDAARAPVGNSSTWSATFYPYMVVGLYWPALFILLRRRNQDTAAEPAAIARRLSE